MLNNHIEPVKQEGQLTAEVGDAIFQQMAVDLLFEHEVAFDFDVDDAFLLAMVVDHWYMMCAYVSL